jgi:hypothetical protein
MGRQGPTVSIAMTARGGQILGVYGRDRPIGDVDYPEFIAWKRPLVCVMPTRMRRTWTLSHAWPIAAA